MKNKKHSILNKFGLSVIIFGITCINAQEKTDAYWLGEARGPYLTGTIETVWNDTSREELGTSNPDDTRRMMVQMWYPASHDPDKEMAIYASTDELYQEWMHIELFDTPTLSQREAELPEGDEKYPVLIYNHGAGTQVFSATYQTEYMASNGYIVVSIGHTGYDGLARFPDGTEFKVDVQSEGLSREDRATMNTYEVNEWRKENEELQESFYTHVLDIQFALDELNKLNATPENRFFQRLDLENIGVFGWSIGGAASLQVARDDERISVAVNMDGELMGRPVEWLGSPKPVLIIQSEQSGGIAGDGVIPGAQQSMAEMNRRIWQMLGKTDADWYRAVIDGTDHISFIDAYHIVEPPESVPDIDYVHSVINQLTLEFFDKYLKGAGAAPLLDGDARMDGVEVARKQEI